MIASLASFISVSAILANTVSAAPLAHGRDSFVRLAARGKDNWWSGLEDYDTYHARYLSFKCQDYHNTEYFDSCCNPLLKDQSVDTLPSECQVGGPASSSSASSSTEDDDQTSTSSTQDWTSTSSTDDYTSTSSTDDYTSTSSSAYVAPTTSSSDYVEAYVAPTTTTSQYVAPTTSTSQYVAATTSVVAAASSNSGSYSGEGTYFYQNGVAGACGTVHADSDQVVALETSMYANGAHCGKYITLYRNGASVTALVADECPTCVSSTSVDMSVGAFTVLGTEEEGMFDITWSFD